MALLFSNIEQKYAYVNALVYIASIDEKISEEESEKIYGISKLYGLSDEEMINRILFNAINRQYSLDEILRPITERKHKISLINDLISLCFIDGEYSEKEKKTIEEISHKLNVEDEKVMILESINRDLLRLNSQLKKELEI